MNEMVCACKRMGNKMMMMMMMTGMELLCHNTDITLQKATLEVVRIPLTHFLYSFLLFLGYIDGPVWTIVANIAMREKEANWFDLNLWPAPVAMAWSEVSLARLNVNYVYQVVVVGSGSLAYPKLKSLSRRNVTDDLVFS